MDNIATSRSDFDYVLQQLENVRGPLAEREMERFLDILAACPRELKDFEYFSKVVYQRNLIFSSPHVELLLLCWLPGQRTPLHDHTGAICGVKVLQGSATEIRFKYSMGGTLIPEESLEVPRGKTTLSRDSDIHMIANLSAQNENLVTLHCYSPPLDKMKMYDQSKTFFSDYDVLFDSIVSKVVS